MLGRTSFLICLQINGGYDYELSLPDLERAAKAVLDYGFESAEALAHLCLFITDNCNNPEELYAPAMLYAKELVFYNIAVVKQGVPCIDKAVVGILLTLMSQNGPLHIKGKASFSGMKSSLTQWLGDLEHRLYNGATVAEQVQTLLAQRS